MIRYQGEILILSCYIQPNAKVDKFVGVFDGKLKIQIMAPPVENKANAYLCKWFAKQCQVPRSQVKIIKGEQSRNKTVVIEAPKIIPEWLKLLY